MCLLNEKQPTYLHPPTGNYYAIDLSIYHPNIYLDFESSVCNDLYGSDHFQILIKETESSNDEQHCRWNLKKANWETFTTLCQEQLTTEKFKTAEYMSAFTSALHDISEKNVFRNPRQDRKDVIHGLMMNVKRQLTNANRHYENLIRIRLVRIIYIPS